VESLNAKSHLGWRLSVQGSNLTPLYSHVKNQLPHFPQTTGLTPSPSPSPFQLHMPTHAIHLLNKGDNIGTSEAFFVRHNSSAKATASRCGRAGGGVCSLSPNRFACPHLLHTVHDSIPDLRPPSDSLNRDVFSD
jgi:hypothetical protein